LVGGKMRIVIQADSDSPLVASDLSVSLVIPELGVNLRASTMLQIEAPDPDKPKKPTGGEPQVDVRWIPKSEMGWSSLKVGQCTMEKDEAGQVNSVLWLINQDFVSWAKMVDGEDLTEAILNGRKDRYALPVCLAMFRRDLEEDKTIAKMEKAGLPYTPIPEEYKLKEQARMAFAVLFAMSPESEITEPDYDSEPEETESQEEVIYAEDDY
jgi:hypothetical protein